jgi:hypothetical protein
MKSLRKTPNLAQRGRATLTVAAVVFATAISGVALGSTTFNDQDPNMIQRKADENTSTQSPSSLTAEVGMPGATEKGCIKCMQAKLFNSSPIEVTASNTSGSSSQQGNQ